MIFNDNLREAAEYMPQTAGSILRNTLEQCGSTDFSRLDEILRYKLITMDTEDIKKILDMNDGVAERFKKYCVNACNSAELLEMVKTKRHAYTRLKRAALHLLLNIKTADFLETPNPPYIRVLGFRKSAERLLSKMIFSASLPVLAGLKNAEQKLSSSAHTMLRKEIESTDIFYLSCGNKKNTFELNQEYRKGIIIV
jgi:predicted nucleotidyltransferase